MKSKVYSFRLREEAITQIEAMEGKNLTEKLEKLIFKCCLEIPAKEKELAWLNEQISEAKYELKEKINRQKIAARQITNALGEIQENLKQFSIKTSKPG